MKDIIPVLRTPALISSGLVVPFVVLEWMNRQEFPVPLFGFMWIMPLAFILILTPLVRDIRAGTAINPLKLSVRIVFLVLIAGLWVSLVNDQMPCFLGVPNCD